MLSWKRGKRDHRKVSGPDESTEAARCYLNVEQ